MTVTTASPVLGFTDWLLSLVQEVVEESGYYPDDECGEWWDRGEIRLRQPRTIIEDLAFDVAQDPDWPRANDDLRKMRAYLRLHKADDGVYEALRVAHGMWQDLVRAQQLRQEWEDR